MKKVLLVFSLVSILTSCETDQQHIDRLKKDIETIENQQIKIIENEKPVFFERVDAVNYRINEIKDSLKTIRNIRYNTFDRKIKVESIKWKIFGCRNGSCVNEYKEINNKYNKIEKELDELITIETRLGVELNSIKLPDLEELKVWPYDSLQRVINIKQSKIEQLEYKILTK